jgi:hypothetical protein
MHKMIDQLLKNLRVYPQDKTTANGAFYAAVVAFIPVAANSSAIITGNALLGCHVQYSRTWVLGNITSQPNQMFLQGLLKVATFRSSASI